MSTSPKEFDLDSLAQQGLEQKLSDIERAYKESLPVIQMAIDKSKELTLISTTQNVPEMKAILEKIISAREAIETKGNDKIKEMESIELNIDKDIEKTQKEISVLEIGIGKLAQVDKGELIIDESSISSLKTKVRTAKRKEAEKKGLTYKDETLTIRDCIDYMQLLEEEAKENLASLKEKKKKNSDRKHKWSIFTTKLIQDLDKMKEEHLKDSYSMISETINEGKKNIEEGEKSLKVLERKYHAALKYRALRNPKSEDNDVSLKLTPTPGSF